jgi:hypothetical protein
VNDTGRPAEPDGLPARRDLTVEQWHVLNEAAQASTLVEVLNSWAPPSPDWKSKARHVSRLSAAAESLVRAELVDVYEEPLGPGESALLLSDETRAAVGARDNWWREDVDQELVLNQDGSYDVTFYTLAITEAGREVLQSMPPGILDPLYSR